MLTSPPEVFARADVLKKREEPFVLATVTAVRGSASAKTGSKALFSARGKNLYGWVGGGCAESFLARQALEVLQAKTPRVVTVDLDDEVFGLMPCGGVMDVYLEPHFPARTITICDGGAWNETLCRFVGQLGYGCRTQGDAVEIANWSDGMRAVAVGLSRTLDCPLRPWREIKGDIKLDQVESRPELRTNAPLTLFGSSRITEEIVRLSTLLGKPARLLAATDTADIEFTPGECVIVASHHALDVKWMARALRANAGYVALVASQKRSSLIVADLKRDGLPAELLGRVFAPAGLALPSDTPTQVAFSICCEILLLESGGREWT